MSHDIASRKLDHLTLCLNDDVAMKATTGFEAYAFWHEALPEGRPEDVDLSCEFLGRRFAAPLLVSSMTGGLAQGEAINAALGRACALVGLPMGLGSQRIALEREEAKRSFAAAREAGPGAFLIANLGAVQFNHGLPLEAAEAAVGMVGADALYLHLNPLQELVQPEGDTDFRGLEARIAAICAQAKVPVLAKEVGSGLSPSTAKRLAAAGCAALDLAGAGGTSWAKIEALRSLEGPKRRLGLALADWGIPTAESLVACREALPALPLIASGGLRNGLEVAKALALGADMAGLAMPFLKPATQGHEAVVAAMHDLMEELRAVMWLAGFSDVAALRQGRDRLRRLGGPR